jgi:hypothetical protein
MSNILENRLANLIHEIKEIKKELIFQKIEKSGTARERMDAWKTLGSEISSKWDNISAVTEIAQQREKT